MDVTDIVNREYFRHDGKDLYLASRFVVAFVFAALLISRAFNHEGSTTNQKHDRRLIDSSAVVRRLPGTHLQAPRQGSEISGGYISLANIETSPPQDLFSSKETVASYSPLSSNYTHHQEELPTLEEFSKNVAGGAADQLAGIWVEDILALRVYPGLTNRAPNVENRASIYKWAWDHGVTALLIHDYRGGTKLYQLNPGVRIAAIYGNGGIDWYISRGGTWYESKDSPAGGFSGPFRIWSCADCNFDLSGRELHYRHYAGEHRLTFQTCVLAEGRSGLMIVEAYLDRTPQKEEKSPYSTLTFLKLQRLIE